MTDYQYNSDKEKIEKGHKAIEIKIAAMQLYSSIALTITTIVLTIFTIRLANSTDSLKEYSFDQIRPYITVQNIDTKITNSDVDATVYIRNSGISPAYESFTLRSTAISLQNGIDHSYIVPNLIAKNCDDLKSDVGYIPLGQQDVRSYQVKDRDSYGYISETDWNKASANSVVQFPSNELGYLRSGKAGFVVIGIVCYKDIAQKNHYTKFCRIFQISEITSNKNNLGTLCDRDNEAT